MPYHTAFADRDLVIGHNGFTYKVDHEWGRLDANKHPVTDCHEMVQDSKGRIILLTNNVNNNVIIYNKDGKLLDTWGSRYPGAHGLSLKNEGGEDFLYITDTDRHIISKTTMDGREVLTIECPLDVPELTDPSNFKPTETAIADNGDIYAADGYGSQLILQFAQDGTLKNTFGGAGDEEDQFHNAHGIAIDSRSGEDQLLVTARQKNMLKYFSMNGEYQSTVDLPGAFICRPVIHGDNVFLATIWSGDGGSNTGFVSILDRENKLISAPGGSAPNYKDGKLHHMHQAMQVFKHPHDVCIDEDDNVYVAQWNAGNVYPTKLMRV